MQAPEWLVFGLGAALLMALAALALVLRRRADPELRDRIDSLRQRQEDLGERLERELRGAIESSASQVRIETGAHLARMQADVGQQVARIAETAEVNARADRDQAGRHLQGFGAGMQQQLADLTRAIQANLAEVRGTLEARLQSLQQGNEARLEQMRATVEEKLQTTLEARLGESFKLVSDRLEQVHRGLGEMQTLAAGVGDLKRVLTNVKTRGTFGEVQLAALLEQVLLPDQYAVNVKTRPGSNDMVEFAIRMPGRGEGTTVWLPIDAKFPTEDYERLVAAHDGAERDAVDAAARALEARVKAQARSIRDKYVEPPHTTDFAILFLPSEGLFAEVLRRPGLAEALNREQRVVVAGPTTLFAMLNSLQMGFRTLAIEQRSGEVWQVLGAVKSEFSKFGDVLARLKSQLQTASNTIESAETRTRAMTRALRTVEELPAERAAELLPPQQGQDEG